MSGTLSRTPGPWHVYTDPLSGMIYLTDDAGNTIAMTSPMEDDPKAEAANAEFIVTAVNSYASSQAEIETLKKALSALLIQALQSPLNSPAHEWGWEAIQDAIAALPDFAALSGGKP